MKGSQFAGLQATLLNIRQSYFIIDDQAAIHWLNPSAESTIGIRLPQAGTTYPFTHNLNSTHPSTEQFFQAIGTQEDFDILLPFFRSDGKMLWISMQGQAYKDSTTDSGSERYYLICVQDVSDTQRKVERLHLLEAVFESTEDVILIAEAEPIDSAAKGPKVVDVNPAFTIQTGYSRDEIIGNTPRILQGPATNQAELNKIRAALESWQPVEAELINYHKDGSPFHVNLIITPIPDENGWFTHWVSIQRNITKRKETESELAKMTALMQQTQRISKTGSWELEIDTGQTIWTDEVYHIHEVDLDFDHNKANGIAFYHPEDRPVIIEALTRAINQQKGFDVRCRFTTAKGRDIWVRSIGEPIVESGKATKIVGLFQDISASIEAEERMSMLSERFGLAAKAAGIGVWDFDPIANTLVWDEEMYSLYGITPNDFEGAYQAWTRCIHPEDLEQAGNDLQLAMAGEKEFDTEFRVIHPDGSTHYIAGKATVIRNEKGIPTRVTGINYDITERKLHLNQLHLLESVVESAKDSIMITEANPESPLILYTNHAHEEMTGYTPEEVIGKNPKIFQGPETNRVELDRIRHAIEIGEPVQAELFNYRKDGGGFWINMIITYVKDPNGKITHFVSVQRDITERKQFELDLIRTKEQAEKASIAKSEFLSTMSHEIRTPLNAVIGMTGLMSETQLDEEQQGYIRTIRQGGENLLSVINDILDYSKIEAGKTELEQTVFALLDPIEDTLDLLSGKAFEKEIELMYIPESPLPLFIQGDITCIRQVLVNLVGNAIKFTQSGEVIVRVRQQESQQPGIQLEFSVSDTGIGIPGEKIHRLFQSFSQVDASTTRQYGGTGLGLAISQQLVELHGGTIWVKSEAGKGSVFSFTIQAGLIKNPPLLVSDLPKLDQYHALIVDDNLTNLTILKGQLQGSGIQTTSFSEPKAALKWLQQSPSPACDVAILDLHMPEMDGVELASEIRQLSNAPDLPLVLLSSGHAINTGNQKQLFNQILQKPARKGELLRQINRLIQGESKDLVPENTQGPKVELDLSAFHILLVEDNQINQKVARRILEKFKVKIEIANNGLEALEFAKIRDFDLILMDMQMPEMDGLEATREIRKLTEIKQPPILAMTANASNKDREACISAGMNAFLTKPIKLDIIRRSLQKWLISRGQPSALPSPFS